MSVKLHSVKREDINMFLEKEGQELVFINTLSKKYELGLNQIVLIDKYIKKRSPENDLDRDNELEDFCERMQNGEFSIESVNGDLVLFRENPGYYKIIKKNGKKPGEKSFIQGFKELDIKVKIILLSIFLFSTAIVSLLVWLVFF